MSKVCQLPLTPGKDGVKTSKWLNNLQDEALQGSRLVLLLLAISAANVDVDLVPVVGLIPHHVKHLHAINLLG